MTRREKTLSIGVLGLAGMLLLYLVANRLVLGRIRDLDNQERDLRKKIGERKGDLADLAVFKDRYTRSFAIGRTQRTPPKRGAGRASA